MERFLKAVLKGIYYAKDNPDEAIDIVLKYAPDEQREHQRFMFETELAAALTGAAQKNGIGWMTRRAVAGPLRQAPALRGPLRPPGRPIGRVLAPRPWKHLRERPAAVALAVSLVVVRGPMYAGVFDLDASAAPGIERRCRPAPSSPPSGRAREGGALSEGPSGRVGGTYQRLPSAALSRSEGPSADVGPHPMLRTLDSRSCIAAGFQPATIPRRSYNVDTCPSFPLSNCESASPAPAC